MITDKINFELKDIFLKLEIDANPEVTISKQSGSEFQSNCVFKASKKAKQSPLILGQLIQNEYNSSSKRLCTCEFVMPGFLNFVTKKETKDIFIKNVIKGSFIEYSSEKKIVIDYGGPNVAKALHVGHLRSAVLGDSLKRLKRFLGNTVYGDVHLGDYGLQIGQVILGLENEEKNIGDFDIKDLERIYPLMSKKCKEDEKLLNEARDITKKLQYNDEKYYQMFKEIVRVSVCDIKNNYDRLDVEFDYWYGESDSFKYIDIVLSMLKDADLLIEDQGAKIIRFEDMSSCLVVKSDGSYLYSTSDLATLYQRVKDFDMDEVIYVVDARQELHLKQVIESAYFSNIVNKNKVLFHAKFGTMNGSDNKPFKTREGGVLKLEVLFDMVRERLVEKSNSNGVKLSDEDIEILVNAVLKFSDLQNFRETNYIFDLERFTEFSGKTGPYICYTAVRIDKIINSVTDFKYVYQYDYDNEKLEELKVVMMNFESSLLLCNKENSMHHLCEYVFNLSMCVNSFYQSQHILSLEDTDLKNYLITNLIASHNIIKNALNLLGIKIPSRM